MYSCDNFMRNTNDNLKEYYAKRAAEYDEVYTRDIPIRLAEQKHVSDHLQKTFQKKYVLEVACGTGYWTQYLAKHARQILATDINQEMLQLANKKVTDPSVQFLICDAYQPPVSLPQFSGATVNFWISHVPKKRLPEFLSTLHSRLSHNATVVFVDDIYQKELGGVSIKKKGNEDGWKRRKLHNNEEYDILKNYYSKDELVELFSPYTNRVRVEYMTHFWMVSYILKK